MCVREARGWQVEALSFLPSSCLGKMQEGAGRRAQRAAGCRELRLTCSCSVQQACFRPHPLGWCLHPLPDLIPPLLTHSHLTYLELGKRANDAGKTTKLKQMRNQRHLKIKEVPKTNFNYLSPSHIPTPCPTPHLQPIHLKNTTLGMR